MLYNSLYIVKQQIRCSFENDDPTCAPADQSKECMHYSRYCFLKINDIIKLLTGAKCEITRKKIVKELYWDISLLETSFLSLVSALRKLSKEF